MLKKNYEFLNNESTQSFIKIFLFSEKVVIKENEILQLYSNYYIATINFTFITLLALITLKIYIKRKIKNKTILEILNNFVFVINLLFFYILIYLWLQGLNIILYINEDISIDLLRLDVINQIRSDQQSNLLQYIKIFPTSQEITIIILCFITTITWLNMFREKYTLTSYFFNLIAVIIVLTNQLLLKFILFEFIFLCIYLFFLENSKIKDDNVLNLLISIMLIGTLLLGSNFLYFTIKYETLDIMRIVCWKCSNIEKYILYCNIFMSYGLKIILLPYYILKSKNQINLPLSLLVFINGFFTRLGLYNLVLIIHTISTVNSYFFWVILFWYVLFIIVFFLMKEWNERIIVIWTTIHEINFLVLFVLYKLLFSTYECIIFVILHGIISSYIFYTIEIFEKKIIYKLKLNITSKKSSNDIIWFFEIVKYTYIFILVMSQFFLTWKLAINWPLILENATTESIICFCIGFILNFILTDMFWRQLARLHVVYIIYTIIKNFKYKNIEIKELNKKNSLTNKLIDIYIHWNEWDYRYFISKIFILIIIWLEYLILFNV